MPRGRLARRIALSTLLACAGPAARAAGLLDNGPAIHIARATGPIEIDGDLSDPGWQGAEPIETWFETNPGDSIPVAPELRNVAWMAYDDHYLYAAFEFDDPEPEAIKSQLGDHDQIGGGGLSDYGGLILDPRGDGKVAQMFLANASSIEYDAISSDASGEDNSPDFFWEAAAKITSKGWQLEMRIPFSSIRYVDPDPDHWGVLLYRNRPRDFRYQYFTSKLPRDRNCFICSSRELTGFSGLPKGAHWVAAPYLSGSRVERPEDGPGSRLVENGSDATGGLDVKYLPTPDTVIDATVNPDFSQIESDTAKITANERFALFQPERRPFFLESVDLFSTPIQAVYTRTFTDPRWGVRATGGTERTKYTVLVGQDQGGGLVVLPGATSSDLALQDFSSTVAIGRLRREYGTSFVSFLYAGREVDGGGHNRVLGPDFEWRPRPTDTITGQLLWSDTETPNRPELAAEWDGRSLQGYAGRVAWSYGDGKWDHYVRVLDVSREFRADDGFVPQVGYRSGYEEVGRSWHPTSGAVRRVRLFAYGSYTEDSDGHLLAREIVPGIGMDAFWNSFVRVELAQEDVRAVSRVFRRRQVRPAIEFYPGRYFAYFAFDGVFGDEIDFANDRLGTGTTLTFAARINSGKHLQISPLYTRRTLDVTAASGLSGRLVTAAVARVNLTWNFNARSWIRLIGQETSSKRRPDLWTFPVKERDRDFAGSAVFAYKLNWQTALYLGYADSRVLDDADQLQPAERQTFFKVSYAFRH
jgi:hypothetical protein